MKSTVVDESLSSYKPMYCSREYQASTRIYILFCIVLKFYLGVSIEIRSELQRNILNFGYGINYKYEGLLVHSFDRFYVVTKFMLPMIGDLKFSKLDFDYTCAYMEKEYAPNTDSRKIYVRVKSLL